MSAPIESIIVNHFWFLKVKTEQKILALRKKIAIYGFGVTVQ